MDTEFANKISLDKGLDTGGDSSSRLKKSVNF